MESQSHQAEPKILDLLSQYPIFSSIAEGLGFWDLIQLSRTCSAIRSHCHGFAGAPDHSEEVYEGRIRQSLSIGQHNTTTWRLYKNFTYKECCEPDHTADHAPLGCKLCSKPVCFACIVKHSFGKSENTFLLRGRTLCKECFSTGNPHSEHIAVKGSTPVKIRYAKSGLCHCTSLDGILCSDCKRKQNEESLHHYKRTCAGRGCHNAATMASGTARVCLWCNCILPTGSLKQPYGPRKHFDADGFENMNNVRRFTSHLTSDEGYDSETSDSGLEIDPPQSVTSGVLGLSPPTLPQDPTWQFPPDSVVPAYSRYPVSTAAPQSSQLQV